MRRARPGAVVAALAAWLAVAACAATPVVTPAPAGTPTVAATASPSASATPAAVGGVVQTAAPITVFGIDDDGAPAALSCPNWLVLATSRLTYTDADLKAIEDALVQYSPTASGHTPPMLRSVPVVPTISTRSWLPNPSCVVNLQITNVTRKTIRVPRLGWRLISHLPMSEVPLRLLDRCSSLGEAPCTAPGGGLGPGSCSWSVANITVAPEPPGTAFAVAPLSYLDDGVTPCPTITLRPGQSTEVATRLTAAQAGVYRLVPIVMVEAGGVTATVDVPHLAASMPVAGPDRFTCFARHDRAYVQVATGEAALTRDGPVWCV